MKKLHCAYSFFLITFVVLTACNSTEIAAKQGHQTDEWLLLYLHESIVPQKPNWDSADFKQLSYFARYRASADKFHRYGGDPIGPIVGIWQIKRYLGEKPQELVCGEEPKYPKNPPGIQISSLAFKKLEDQWSNKRDEFYICHQNNNNSNNYAIVAQPRPANHASYQVHMSFGPLVGVATQALLPEQLEIKDQLYYADCRKLGLPHADKSCHRLTGEDSNLYYHIRSLLKNTQSSEESSSPYQDAPLINTIPVKWEEIKGIEISASQYEYLEKRCQLVFECYLDDKAPELTDEQKAYIKATAWDMDTNFTLQDQLINRANDFRFR